MTLDTFLTHCYEKGYFNGTWLLKKKGEVVSKGAIGRAHPYQDTPLRVDTVFEIASVSKHFTATAIMILRDRGLLSLDDPLEKYIPGVPYPGIVVKNLLNHTSGLPDYMEWLAELGNRENTVLPNSSIVRFLLESGAPPVFAPTTDWSYCNTAYSVLACIVELVSGKSFPDFMRDEIFVPCGMNDSCVYHRRMNGISIDNYAYGMVLTDDGYKLPDDTEEHAYVIPLDGMEGDGIVNTTVLDMLKWDEAQRKETVLKRASQEEMATPTTLLNGERYPYGYGWSLEGDPDCGRALRHGGGWPGYNTHFLRLLDEDTMVVVFCNQTGCESMARSEVFTGASAIAFGHEPPLPRTLDEYEDKSVDRSGFPALCGAYQNGITVYMDGELLKIKLYYREQDIDCELVPVGEGRFLTRMGGFPVSVQNDKVQLTQMNKEFVYSRL